MEFKNYETYLLWVGDMPSKMKPENVKTQLEQVNSSVCICQNDREFQNFLDSHPKEKLFIIFNGASKSISEQTRSKLEASPRVQHVWILIAKPNLEKKGTPSTVSNGKITSAGSFNDLLISEIQQVIRRSNRQNFDVFEFDNTKQRTTRDLSRNGAAFLWFQLLLKVLSDMHSIDTVDEKMIEQCIAHYKRLKIEKELRNIEEYRRQYKKEEALNWYTRDTFLYRLVNEALRMEDVQCLYTFRSFIVDVCEAIRSLKDARFKASGLEIIKLYRGQYMKKREVAYLRTMCKKLISTNGFFSTTKTKSVAEGFLEEKPNSNDLLPILFEITASTSLKNVHFADISAFSRYPDEQEILFALGAVFKIESIERSSLATDLYVVKMTATDDGNSALKSYEDLCAHDLEEVNQNVIFGRLLIEMGQYKESKYYFQCLIDSMKRSVDEDDLTCAPFYHNIGRAHACMGELNEAYEYMNKALKIRRRYGKLDDPEVARTLNSIGVIEGERGKYADAMGKFKEALEIFEKEYKSNEEDRQTNLHIAITKTNLGWIYHRQGEYEQSIISHQEALKKRERFLPKKHPLIADSFTALGALYQAQGEYEYAKHCFEKALSIRVETLPENHPAVANSHQALGGVCLENGHYPTALQHYQKAMDILRETLPEGHFLIAGCEKSIGSVYLEKGDLQEALAHYQKALEISRQTLSSNHLMAGECFHCIGMVYERECKYQDTLENYKKALDLIQAVLPTEHSSVAKVLSSTATVYLRLGELAKAEMYLTRSYDIQMSIYQNENHPDLALTLNNLGILCTHKSEYVRAEQYLTRALPICEQCFSSNHLTISRTRFNLGELYIRQGKYKKATDELNQALELRTNALPSDDLSLGDIHVSLGYAYFGQRDYVRAQQNYMKSADIYRRNKYPEGHPVLKRVRQNLNLIEEALSREQEESQKNQ